MEVKELQKKVTEFNKAWHKKRGHSPTEQASFNHLVEEVGELARQFVNRDTGREKFDPDEVENAIGDILIHLIDLATQRGLDIEKVIQKILKEDQP